MLKKPWKRGLSTALLVSVACTLPIYANAYDYTSYKGVPFADPALIPTESKTSDDTKKTDELKTILQSPDTVLGALPESEAHPGLWFKEDELASYQARKNIAGSYYQQLWSKLKADVDNIYGKYDYTDPKLHENDRSRGAKLLAFYYVMIKDDSAYSDAEKSNMLAKAIDATVHMYTGTVAARTKDDGDIYWATYLQNYAAAYDWLYPYLSDAQNKEARTRLKKEASFIADWLIQPQPPRPHNHRSKPALGLGTVALTLADEPEAQYWMNLAIERTHNVLDYQFSQDGISREGAHYGQFTFVNLIPFMWQYRKAIGDHAPANLSPDKLIERVQPIFEYALKVRMGNGWLPSTEDSYVKPYSTHMVAGLYKNADGSRYGSGLKLGELLQWSYQNTHAYLADYTGATSQYQIAIDEYLTYDDSIKPVQPTASRTMFLDGGLNPKTNQPFGGVAVLGNQWDSIFEAKGKDTLWLTFNGVPESDNHQHQDQLHFNLFGKNTLFANDTGYGQYSAFASVLKTPQSHNVVTMNGRGVRNETDPMMQVRSAYEIDTDHFDFAQKEGDFYADDKSVMGTHTRGIAFPGQEYFVVADQLTSKIGKADFNMYLHSLGSLNVAGHHAQWSISKQSNPELTVAPDPNAVPQMPDYHLGEGKMEAYVFPQTAPIGAKEGVTSLFKEDLKEQYISVPQAADSAQYLTILVPQQLNEQAPDVEDLSTAGVSAARMTTSRSTDTYILQQNRAAEATAGHLTTDASFSWIRETSGSVTDLMLREGTNISIGGSKLVASSIPVTLVQHRQDNVWNGKASDLTQEAAVSLQIPAGVKVKSVSVSGQKLDQPALEHNTLTLTLKPQEADFQIELEGTAAVKEPPTAQYTADKASEFGERGKGTRTVRFSSAASKGKGLKYAWSFGDGTVSEQASPTKEFSSFGTYLVNLKVTDEAGATDTKTMVIENRDPNRNPVPAFTTNLSTGRPPLAVAFDASASFDPDASLGDKIVKYDWDLGDASPLQSGETLVKVEHTFNKVGSFQATLTVTDALGASASYSMPVSIGSPSGYIEVAKKSPEDEQIYTLFEAEDFTYNSSSQADQISLVSSSKASGGQFVKFGRNIPDLTKEDVLDPAYKDTMPADKILNDMVYVEYELKVKDPGSFQVHVYSTGESASNGSVLAQWDDADLKRITLKDKDWKRAYDNFQYKLDEGIHTLRLYSRKSGADIDRILIMTDGTTHTKVQSTIIPKLDQTYPATLFNDTRGHWARAAIDRLAVKKIIEDQDRFAPDDRISGKDFTNWLSRIPGMPDNAIQTSAGKSVTRQQAAVLIAGALRALGDEAAAADTDLDSLLSSYQDAIGLDQAVKLDLALVLKTGIMGGTASDRLSLEESATRAQIAMLIDRLVEYVRSPLHQ